MGCRLGEYCGNGERKKNDASQHESCAGGAKIRGGPQQAFPTPVSHGNSYMCTCTTGIETGTLACTCKEAYPWLHLAITVSPADRPMVPPLLSRHTLSIQCPKVYKV